jgi:hypothetical protein
MTGKFKEDRQVYEWSKRVLRLTNPPRSMSPKAAMLVVDAAMFGIGCIEGKVRKRIEAGMNPFEARHC